MYPTFASGEVNALLFQVTSAVMGVATLVAVVYVPFLQQAFSTVSLSAADWVCCTAVASSVLWLREASKLVTRAAKGRSDAGAW